MHFGVLRQNMKRLSLFSALFVATGFVTCGDDGSSFGQEGGESSALEESSSSDFAQATVNDNRVH